MARTAAALAVACVCAAPAATQSPAPFNPPPIGMDDDRMSFARLLGALQTLERDPPPALLVSPRSALDAARATILLQALRPELERRAQAYAARLAAPPVLEPPVDAPLARGFGQPAPGGMSQGLLWTPAAGAEVRSPVDGTVLFAGEVRGFGVVLILGASGGYHVVLAGLEAATGGVGRRVSSGEAVGRMADAGGAPPELYLEVRRDGAPVDPARFLHTTTSRDR